MPGLRFDLAAEGFDLGSQTVILTFKDAIGPD
jgi:hypothetical protein